MSTRRFNPTASQVKAVKMCLAHNVPFALYALPGEAPVFIASVPGEDECRNEWPSKDKHWKGFFINFFANDEEYVAGVEARFDEESVMELLRSNPAARLPRTMIEPPCRTSTDRLRYLAMATSIITRLKHAGGKTVFSRVIVEDSPRSIIKVATDYFNDFPHTFRYICFTQETGVWLGATPEIILDYTTTTGRLHTMALAGTQPAGAGRWSRKNIEEQRFVRDFIVESLDDLGATEIMETDPEPLVFGPVEHLCTRIKARLKVPDPRGLLYALSPTPALAGLPRESAIKELLVSETHNRLCYGGFVGVTTGSRIKAWANLRCATVRDDNRYFIFAGGGLTGRSHPRDEWEETEAKSLPLRQAVTLRP